MATEDAKSLRSNAPFDGKPGVAAAATANDFGIIKFMGGATADNQTHSADELPSHWHGREVGVICSGGTCHLAFSTLSSAEVDRNVSATQAGASLKVGVPVPDSLSVEARFRLPTPGPGEKLYFVRESSAASVTVWMRLLA